jgi:hypothetical protein
MPTWTRDDDGAKCRAYDHDATAGIDSAEGSGKPGLCLEYRSMKIRIRSMLARPSAGPLD